MSDGELDETMVNALSTQIKEEEGTEPTEDQINEVIAKENRKVQDINMKLAEHQEEIARLYSNGKQKEAQELMTKLTAEAQGVEPPGFQGNDQLYTTEEKVEVYKRMVITHMNTLAE